MFHGDTLRSRILSKLQVSMEPNNTSWSAFWREFYSRFCVFTDALLLVLLMQIIKFIDQSTLFGDFLQQGCSWLLILSYF